MDRVQRKRTKGAKLPPNTLCVTRPGKWGNPFKGENAVEKFREYVAGLRHYSLRYEFISYCKVMGVEHLACFCGLDKECHADVWLEIWNSRDGQDTVSNP